MELNRFFKVLNNPIKMSNEDTFIFEDIVNEFPFFQAARALFLKGLKNQKSFRYNDFLKTTAVYTADRSILFDFITSTEFENINLKSTESQLISEFNSIDENVKENLDFNEHNVTDDEIEKLNHLIASQNIKSADKEQSIPEFNDINDFFKNPTEQLEQSEDKVNFEYEILKNPFSFDKLDDEVRKENKMSFEEEIEKIANEFLKKIEADKRTYEPEPEFKLEEVDELDEFSQIIDNKTDAHNIPKTETDFGEKNTVDNLETLLNFVNEDNINNENELNIVDQTNEKEISKNSNIEDLEAEFRDYFEKLEDSEPIVSPQNKVEIEDEIRNHFTKIENQIEKDKDIGLQNEFDKKEQIKREVIEYFTNLDKDCVLDDVLFEKMTHDLPNELKEEIENEIILHFTQSYTPSEIESDKMKDNNSSIDPIESEIIAHFNQSSSSETAVTDQEIHNHTAVDVSSKTDSASENPFEREIREHFEKINQEQNTNQLGNAHNIPHTEEVQNITTSEKVDINTQQEEIIFELLPNEIFSLTLTDEKTNIQEKIELNLDEDFSPPVQFHRNDKHSFSEWLKLSSFKPIVRQQETIDEHLKERKMELINEFIEKNPKIEPTKDKVIQPAEKDEFIENQEIMTETLARLYVLQHKYSEAIRAYEILSLKFPEKSIFFADQIRHIEKIRKNNSH